MVGAEHRERRAMKTVSRAALALMLTAGPAAAQDVTLTLHHFLSAESMTQKAMLEPWAERIAETSDGRLEIAIHPAMTLGGKPPQLVRQARDRVVDMVWTLNGYTAGLFPRTEVFELPDVHRNDATATNLAMRALYDDWLAPEYDGLKVLFLHVHAGNAIQMAEQPVRAVADLEGLRMRIPSRSGGWVLEAFGAAPVGMPVPELPQALARGVVDGALIPFQIIPGLKLQDLTSWQIEGPDALRFGTSVFQVSMNAESWAELPTDLQGVILAESGEDWLREIGAIWTAGEADGLKAAVGAGNGHIVLREAEMAKADAALAEVAERWVAAVAQDGVDGAALLAAARASVAANAAE